MQFPADEPAAAVGLTAGTARPGSAAKRATPSRIRAHGPALADHLDATIHTGTFCSYAPDPRAPITEHTWPPDRASRASPGNNRSLPGYASRLR